jgi:hypothetical protein
MQQDNQTNDLLALLVYEHEGQAVIETLPVGDPKAEEWRGMMAKLAVEIDNALRAYGFDDVAEVKARLRLPVQRMFRARQAAFDHIVQLACEHELDNQQ